MKNKYGIGFLLFLILVVFGITCAYQLSLNKGKREIQAEINAKEQKGMNNTSVAADGQALKDDCYYLKELNGYVVVYLSDKKTVLTYDKTVDHIINRAGTDMCPMEKAVLDVNNADEGEKLIRDTINSMMKG